MQRIRIITGRQTTARLGFANVRFPPTADIQRRRLPLSRMSWRTSHPNARRLQVSGSVRASGLSFEATLVRYGAGNLDITVGERGCLRIKVKVRPAPNAHDGTVCEHQRSARSDGGKSAVPLICVVLRAKEDAIVSSTLLQVAGDAHHLPIQLINA